jgi:hypothetical protein
MRLLGTPRGRSIGAKILLAWIGVLAALLLAQVVVAGFVSPRQFEVLEPDASDYTLQEYVWGGRPSPVSVGGGYATILGDEVGSKPYSYLSASAAREMIGDDGRVDYVVLWVDHPLLESVFRRIVGEARVLDYDYVISEDQEERGVASGEYVYYAGHVWVSTKAGADDVAVVKISEDALRFFVLPAGGTDELP